VATVDPWQNPRGLAGRYTCKDLIQHLSPILHPRPSETHIAEGSLVDSFFIPASLKTLSSSEKYTGSWKLTSLVSLITSS
jgi:hypothetical protein